MRTAEKEAIKLRATCYNNIAVGLVITGAFVPYIAIYQSLPHFVQRERPMARHA
jgi:hypothetical protein